ncbi:hypothetical protein [Capnocytophaga cynodegmi]|uniref:Uncharacterized protein n=1 Tax=Capnocytophaga cynodegmi TaxID=28189 RepID=A0A0B7HPP9_9FLAO|nr:hypothetical protein [Capnocytophaga cynodegmi]CEN40619.1 exported hypothetical protein [Capnocytophaga cynodegmi]
MKTQEKVTIVLSGLAFILSVITFAIAYTRFEMPDLNTGSFLVSVLAVLVTFLLGWQIYNAVGVKRELEKFEEKINGYKTEINTIIDKKVTESERKIEYENFQNLARISFEFYGQFNFLSLLSNVELSSRLPLLMGAIIYGSYIEDMEKEVLESYRRIIDIFRETVRTNENEIRAMDNEVKENLLRKIRLFPNIFEFRELERILESE